jgi:hypothetical protein
MCADDQMPTTRQLEDKVPVMRIQGNLRSRLLVIAILSLTACSSRGGSGGGDSDGNSGGNSGSNGNNSGEPGSSGAINSGGTRGTLPMGDPSSDPPPNNCNIQFRPLSAPALTNLSAGPGRTVTVQAERSSPDSTSTDWTWTVSHNGTRTELLPDPNDPSIVTLPLPNEGRYELSAQVDSCHATTTISAVAADKRTAYYWLRVLPPEGSPFVPHEQGVGIRADIVEQNAFELLSGYTVPIDPRVPNALELASAIPSYLRLSAPGSSFLQEGRTTAKGATTFRVSPLRQYNLMIIPDNGWAPQRFDGLMLSGATVPSFSKPNNPDFELSQGTEIRVRLRDAGFAVVGARVLFRAGALPSTLGASDEGGNTRIYVAGDGNRSFGAQVIAPPGKGLPDLALDASSGLRLPAPRNVAETMTIDWAPMPRGKIEIAIVSEKSGLPIRDAQVVAQFSAPLANAGTIVLNGGPTVALSGRIKLQATSDGNGKVLLDAIPRTQYTLTVTPPMGSDSSITTTLDLSTVDPGPTEIRVPERVRFFGRFTGTLTTGSVIEAIPDDPTDNRRVSASLDANGGYTLLLDREKNYRLRLRVGEDTRLTLPLGMLRAEKTGSELPPRALPRTVSLQGMATNKSLGVPGALVEVYCLADLPDCIDFRAPNVNGALRIAEGRTDGKGRFQIPLPDPSDE